MKLPRKKRDETSATLTQTLGLILALSGLLMVTSFASDPAWWSSSGTGSQSAVVSQAPSDYAVVTQGQLKQFTARAVDELNTALANYGGAGPALTNLVYGWQQDYATHGYNASNIKPSDYTAMNVGQLKTIAGLVYGRLSAVGYTELTPSWLHQNTATDNTLANLGQLKQVFDFDLSLPNASNLTATAGASGTINLSWTLPSTNNASSWLVEQQNSDGTWTVIATLSDPNATSYSITGLTNGQNYNFQVIGSGANSVSLPVSASGAPTSIAPGPSPGPGRYLASQIITVTSSMADATIYYTTDGTDPTTSSSSIANGGQLTVNSNTLYKFIAISGSSTSSETTALYRIDGSGDLEAGDSFTMVRKPDSTVWTWGDDGRGQQGDNQANNPAAQPQQVPNLTGITRVTAAGDHAFAVKNDGTAWAWGADDQSQGGDGGTSDLFVPTQITGLSNIAAVYAGEFQGFAVDNSGNLYAWGTNNQGQLGDGTTNNHGTPEAISLITGVVKVVSSFNHTLLLKSDGTVWATGDNSNGELGDGTYNNALTFRQVPGLTNVVDIAAGCDPYGGHSMALLADGSVWTWGVDWYGELGDGNFNAGSVIPELIIVPPAVAIVAVDSKSYVVLADGTVRCFGGNSEGEMGIGTTQNQASPAEPTGINNVSLLAAGTYHAVVCTTTGAFYAWGDNTSFKLTQDFNNFTRDSEVHDDAAQGFTSVASAETATIGLKSDGTVWAVGNGSDGLLGQGQSGSFSTKMLIQIPGLSNISQIAGGEDAAFAIDNNGTLWAWGQNGNGQLGVGNTSGAPLNAPTQVLNVQNVGGVVAGDAHMLAVQWDGTVWATGDNTDGELGDGTTTPEAAPIPVTALNSIIAKAAAVGSNTSFVLDSNGNVWAWGRNDSGQLGLGTTGDVATPTQITGLSAMVAISARFGNAMGIDSSGNVWTWGGMGNSDGTPLQQPGLSNVIAVAAGGFHQLAIESDGTLWGWGIGGQGQLGNGSYNIDYSPTQLTDVQGAVAIAANYEASFLVKADGSLSGFGSCNLGQIGANLGIYNYSPKPLLGIALNETPPTVSITSPGAGASLPFGNAIQFQASASASTGSIAKVDYYLEGVKLGTSTTSGMWDFSYTPLSSGDYTFEAVATDSAGVATISTPVTINVSIASPIVAIVSGNNQTGTSGAFLPNAFVVSVTNSSGTPLANATVTFSVMQGSGLIGTSTTTAPSNSVQVMADANGIATAYFKQPLVANYTSAISVTASNLIGQSSTSFMATTPVDNGAPAAPANLTATAGGSGEIDLVWANNADNAASNQVQQQNSDGSWTTVATLNPNQSFAAVTGLTLGTNYNFRVLAINAVGQAQIGLNAPTQAQGPSRYAIFDLGTDRAPLKITDSGFVLMGDDQGNNYYRWANGTAVQLTVPAGYTIAEVTDITEDGTIVGDGLDPSHNSVLLTWYQTYSAATISYPPQSGGAAGSISSPYVDPSFNVWSTQTGDGFYNDVEIGNATLHLNPYPFLDESTYGDTGAIQGRWIYWSTGDSVVPLMVNESGVGACSKTVYNTTTFSAEDYSGYFYPNIPTLVSLTENIASTNSYILSNHGADSGTQIPFKPIALSNANGIIGQPEPDGPYAYWDSTGTTTLSSGFTPGSVNAALDSNSNPAYQILGNDGGGNLQLLEMNPQTGQFPTNATDITAYIPQDSRWTDFSPIFGVGASQVINDSGAIVCVATPTDQNGNPILDSDGNPVLHGVMLQQFTSELAVDADRNGTIVMASENPSGQDIHGNPVDVTSLAKPFQFWLNNDQDTPDSHGNPETVPPTTPDYNSNTIVSTRDLEDWTRLWIYTKGLNAAIQAGTIKVGLKWKQVVSGTPEIKIVRATDFDGETEYLEDIPDAKTQATTNGTTPRPLLQDATPGVSSNYLVKATISSPSNRASDFVFPTSAWTNLTDASPKTFFLFEGASRGEGELEIVFLKSDGTTVIGEGGSVWLDLRDIKEMYEREISGLQPDKPYNYSSTPPSVDIQASADPSEAAYPFVPNPTEDTTLPSYIVFVHGYNMLLTGSTNHAETMFKRLWWRGYKGRFAAFRWNTYGNGSAPTFPNIFSLLPGGAVGTYNDSEFVAWHSGAALKCYVQQLQSLPGSYAVNVVSHSMGSIVVGEALEEGMLVDNYAILHGAASASCYSTSSQLFSTTNFGFFSPDTSSDSATSSMAYREAFANIASSFPVNFFDDQDSTIGWIWDANNYFFKPQHINNPNPSIHDYYYYNPLNPAGQKLGFEADTVLGSIVLTSQNRALTDFAEARAYADFSLTATIGHTPTPSGFGSIVSGIDENQQQYGFGDHHSNEFNWSIQQLKPFYSDLMDSFFLTPNP